MHKIITAIVHQQYVLPVTKNGASLDGRTIKDICQEWFEKYPMDALHAARDGYHIAHDKALLHSENKLMDTLHPEPIPDGDPREDLAALEHWQWAKAVAYVLDNLSPETIDRWKQQIATPYAELSESEKESDRRWADRATQRINQNPPQKS